MINEETIVNIKTFISGELFVNSIDMCEYL